MSTADIDLGIEVVRLYVRRKIDIPLPLLETLDTLIRESPVTAFYFYNRVRRYPSLRKAMYQRYEEIEAGEVDDIQEIPDVEMRIPALIQAPDLTGNREMFQ